MRNQGFQRPLKVNKLLHVHVHVKTEKSKTFFGRKLLGRNTQIFFKYFQSYLMKHPYFGYDRNVARNVAKKLPTQQIL